MGPAPVTVHSFPEANLFYTANESLKVGYFQLIESATHSAEDMGALPLRHGHTLTFIRMTASR